MQRFKRGDRVTFTHDDGRVLEGVVTVGRTKGAGVKIEVLTRMSPPKTEETIDGKPAGRTWMLESTIYTVPLTVPKYNIQHVPATFRR